MALRLIDATRMVQQALESARRFPYVLAMALLGAGAGVVAIGGHYVTEAAARICMVALLGIPLLTALALLGERRRLGVPLRHGLAGAALVALLVFYLLWPGFWGPVAQLRYLEIVAVLHLAVAFLPFVGVTGNNGFWQYNRLLLQRVLLAAIFSGVLIAGLSIALVAIDRLLGVPIGENTYPRLMLVIAFVFNTWFFLAGVPRELPALEERDDYPLVLKVFAQFILTPITLIYLLILTVYLGKVVVTQQWPSGWIGYLVSSVAVVGILSLLLVYPVRERGENRWVATYARWFWLALLPSIVMVLMAAGKRIEQYGFTELRWLLVVLALWLAGLAVHQTITRSHRIRAIPASLCILLLFMVAGPWSPFAVAHRSQQGRLQRLLTNAGMLANGQVRPITTALAFDDRKEISGALRYLLETDPHGRWTEWFGPERLAAVDTVGTHWGTGAAADERARRLIGGLGIAYVNRWQAAQAKRLFYRVARTAHVLPVEGYDRAIVGATLPFTVALAGRPTTFELDTLTTGQRLVVRQNADTLLTWPLAEIAEMVRQPDLIPSPPDELAPAGAAVVSDSGAVARNAAAPTDSSASAAHNTSSAGPSGMTRGQFGESLRPVVFDAGNDRIQLRVRLENVTGDVTDHGARLRDVTATFFIRLTPRG